MSMPKCLTNPKLRLVNTKHGFVTLEIIENGYNVFKEGRKIGSINKLNKGWITQDCSFKNRKEALDQLGQTDA